MIIMTYKVYVNKQTREVHSEKDSNGDCYAIRATTIEDGIRVVKKSLTLVHFLGDSIIDDPRRVPNDFNTDEKMKELEFEIVEE